MPKDKMACGHMDASQTIVTFWTLCKPAANLMHEPLIA